MRGRHPARRAGRAGPYDLFVDLNRYCGIPPHRRAAPGAQPLMFGYSPGALDDRISGVTGDELRARFTGWELAGTTPGTNEVPTFWFTLRRTG